MRQKIDTMTKTLEDIYQEDVISHRAGRWGFDERYARLLVESGYHVDCSVTPLMDWSGSRERHMDVEDLITHFFQTELTG